ncbi:hypothetical protein [Aquimarina sp. 2201CG5-10]|uniref:hypothetical protein n=1 Tax=Aquimarina callyspongiae TaxID=3098150 RepID=UPI002AB5363E|nr:hypothetical protein [Aquimarina sp. 2201CG5-10]MDY8137612.1 hypothetical protein [Aquimarina sp. 2201CG5-10]
METLWKNRKKKVILDILTIIVISTVVVSSIAVTFLHEYEPSSSKKYTQIKKDYKKIISKRDTSYESLLLKLQNNKITKEQYIASYISTTEISKCELQNYHSIKNEIKKEDSVLGYTSYKNYLLGIGLPIFGFVSSLFFLFIVVKNVKGTWKRYFYLFISFAFIATWGYWVSWSNLNHTQDPTRPGDFPRLYYNIALYILPGVFFFSAYFLINSFKTIEEKVGLIIKLFYKALYRDLPQGDLVNPEKETEFRIFRTELTKKAVEHE